MSTAAFASLTRPPGTAPSACPMAVPDAPALRVLARPGGPADDLAPAQRRVLTALILVAHLAAVWGLLQISAVREAVQRVAPIFVSLVTPPAPPAPAPLPKPVLPPPQRPVALKPPPPAPSPTPLLVAAPSPAPAAFTMPVAAEPVPVAAPATATAAAVAVATAAPAPAPAPAPRLIPASAVQYLEPPVVDYPRQSKRNGETGRVLLRAYVGATGGAPRTVQVSRSSGHARLDDAALAAVQRARFKPYTDNGQPVEGWALIPIDFELEK